MTDKSMLTRRILAELEAGPLTLQEVAAKCGIDVELARKTLGGMGERLSVEKVTHFVITTRGHNLLNNEDPEVIRARLAVKKARAQARATERRRERKAIKRAMPGYVAPVRGRPKKVKPAPIAKVADPVEPADDEADLNCPERIKRMAEQTVREAMTAPHPLHAAWCAPVLEAA